MIARGYGHPRPCFPAGLGSRVSCNWVITAWPDLFGKGTQCSTIPSYFSSLRWLPGYSASPASPRAPSRSQRFFSSYSSSCSSLHWFLDGCAENRPYGCCPAAVTADSSPFPKPARRGTSMTPSTGCAVGFDYPTESRLLSIAISERRGSPAVQNRGQLPRCVQPSFPVPSQALQGNRLCPKQHDPSKL